MNQPTYALQSIPNGNAGIRDTLHEMERVAIEYSKHPLIFELSRALVKKLPEKRYMDEAAAILRFVQNNIRYVKDVANVETLQTPDQTLRIGQGDCDDKATLAASLLLSIGHRSRFVAVGQSYNLSHVYLETLVGRRWIALECIEKGWPLGKAPKMRNRVYHHINP